MIHYSMTIEWAPDDQVYVVSLPEWGPYAKTHGATYEAAVKNARDVLAMLIASATERGEPLPQPRAHATA